jgi:hypothetical protein
VLVRFASGHLALLPCRGYEYVCLRHQGVCVCVLRERVRGFDGGWTGMQVRVHV